ncbi:hypothetical protein QFZ53_001471 [Microbacterium natoriense]|uniref:PepSY domain-containing protein n=1 Tax=Microbacterium natoriense TaxID=284570 RepID=A0AAW8EV06_9MICO|nr:hypothetical protein [Microbacterium natoriense]MDQ0647275.1 hypothetical protein [Microbacterium natoriense]
MFQKIKKMTAVATVGIVVGGVFPLASQAAYASAAPTAVATEAKMSRGPIMVKQFWSAILRLFITISKHASDRMRQYGISDRLLQQILNEGRVVGQGGGVTKIRFGQWEARVNSSTGNVITVIKNTSGGSSGGR